MVSLGRKVTLTVRKEDPQARLLHTLHVFISFAPHPSSKWDSMTSRPDGKMVFVLCVLRCARRVHTAVVPVVACWEPSGAELPFKES